MWWPYESGWGFVIMTAARLALLALFASHRQWLLTAIVVCTLVAGTAAYSRSLKR